MKKKFILTALLVFILVSCKKNNNTILKAQNSDSEIPVSTIRISTTDDILYINILNSCCASEVQRALEENNYNLSNFSEVKLELANRNDINICTFVIDNEFLFLSRLTDIILFNFDINSNGYLFNNVKNIFLSSYKDDNLDDFLSRFPNINFLYINDKFFNKKIESLEFLYNQPSLKSYELILYQDNKDILNSMLCDFAKRISTGKFNIWGLVNIHSIFNYPLSADEEYFGDLTYVPDWYTGLDCSGIPCWINYDKVEVYESPSLSSNVISSLNKNDFCIIKSYYSNEYELGVQYYFPYVDNENFLEENAYSDDWYKIGFENGIGYIQGKKIRLAY